ECRRSARREHRGLRAGRLDRVRDDGTRHPGARLGGACVLRFLGRVPPGPARCGGRSGRAPVARRGVTAVRRIALFVVVVALATVPRLSTAEGTFRDSGVVLGGEDSYYHMRRIELALDNGGVIPPVDRYVNY